MVVCPRCNLTHEIGEELCRKCGSFLLTDEEDYFLKVEKVETQLICPICQDLYHQGNYCKKCGSLLRQDIPSLETNRHPLEIKWIKDCSKEWLKLRREKKELEVCLKNLETQKKEISNDMFALLWARYQERLKELLPLHQEMEAELESVRRRASEEIDLLEKELKPLQTKLEEFQFINKQEGITRVDFLKEKEEVNRNLQTRVRNLKKWRRFLSVLPGEMRKDSVSKGFKEILFQPFTILVISTSIILLGTGGFVLSPWYLKSSPVIPSKIVSSLPTPSLSPKSRTNVDDQEVLKIKALFDAVKQANLQKNIDLFMNCFAHDFTGKEKKRSDTLKTRNHFHYLNLSYDLKQKRISGDIADVRLEWSIRVSEKGREKPEDNRIIFDTTLRKENGHWKIQQIRPVS